MASRFPRVPYNILVEKSFFDAHHFGNNVELKSLWELSSSASGLDACAACDALVCLVQEGHVCFNYTLRTLLNNVPTAKTLVGVCRALTDLLVLQLCSIADTTTPGQPVCLPYGIRNTPHPYISLLCTRSDCWPSLQEEIHRLLAWKHRVVSRHVLVVLDPLVRFLLLEPQQSVQFSQIRSQLVRTLLQSSPGQGQSQQDDGYLTRDKVVEFLLDLVPCYQLNSNNKLGEVTCALEDLAQHLQAPEVGSGSGTTVPRPVMSVPGLDSQRRWARHALSLAVVLQREGLNATHVLRSLTETVKRTPEMIQSDVNLLTVAELLYTSYHSLPFILQLGKVVVNQKDPVNPYLAAMLVLPALHALSMPSLALEETSGPSTNQSLAAQLITSVEVAIGRKNEYEPSQVYANICNLFVENPASVQGWLDSIEIILSSGKDPPIHVTFLVAAILIVSREPEKIQSALKLFPQIASQAEDQAMSLLPVLMYKLSECEDPKLKLHILNTIPELTVSKVTIAPALRTIQALSASTSLRPLALRLMTSLWRHQDRCFPHLHTLLLGSRAGGVTAMSGSVDELMIAKAASIRDICVLRGQQYGEDVLSLLSEILTACMGDLEAPVAGLALQGLRALCEDEVIDMRTTWVVLAPKLNSDERPLVVQRICELFSLVPELEVESDDYEDFVSEIAGRLWKFSEKPTACDAAYSALSFFKQDHFTLDMLPAEVTEEVRAAVLAAAPDIPGQEVTMPAPPGFCYINLLHSVPQHAHSGYEKLLTCLLTNEARCLPRGIHHASSAALRSSAHAQSASSNESRAVEGVPPFLHAQYEKNKQPALRQGLAVGLLFTYDPPAVVGRDGKPRKQALVTRGRTFHQMLYTLLHEISVEETDWHRCMVLPEAWVNFMHRCFNAYLQSRVAELELRLQQGEVVDLEEHHLDVQTAWLWSRDKLLDLIKSVSKGSPGAQANSISAVIGLAVTVHQYACALDPEQQSAAKEASEFAGHAYWMSILVNTVLAVLEPGRPPAGRIFPICHQSHGSERSASTLARGAAAVCSQSLVRLLATSNTDALLHILASLQRRVPGQGDAEATGDQAKTLEFYNGLGLGSLLGRLFEERFVDVTGTEGMVAVWKALNILEAVACSDQPNRLGCILGVSVCLTAMCADAKLETRVHVTHTLQNLTQRLLEGDVTDEHYAALCMCVASVTVRAYAANLVAQEMTNQIVAHLYQTHLNLPHSAGVYLSLGCVCQGLLKAGHPTVGDLAVKLGQSWLTMLQDQEVQSEQRVACAAGVFSLAGSETQQHSDAELTLQQGQQAAVKITEVIETARDAVTSHSDLGTHNACAWMLGRLHAAIEGSTNASAAVPSNYSYLPDSSLLKPVIAQLQDAVKGTSGAMEARKVEILLRSLCVGAKERLPPLNWAAILSAITREFPELETLCVKIGILQSAWAPSAALYVTSQLQAPQFDCLKPMTQRAVYNNLQSLVKVVSPGKLEAFLELGLLLPFSPSSASPDLRLCALQGLHAALQVQDPPQQVTFLLYQALGSAYQQLPNSLDFAQWYGKRTSDPLTLRTFIRGLLNSLQMDLFASFCRCLQELPDDIIDQLTQDDLQSATFVKGLYVRCHLVSEGCQPLAWINPALEAALYNKGCDRETLLWLLMRCFLGCKAYGSVSPILCQHWLLELMGLIKALATKTKPVPEGCNLATVLDLVTQVFAAAVITWSGIKASLILGLPPPTSSPKQPQGKPEASVISKGTTRGDQLDFMTGRVSRANLYAMLPAAMTSLTSVEPWKQIIARLLDWMLAIHNTDALNSCCELKTVYRACLRSLRHKKDFCKQQVWSAVHAL